MLELDLEETIYVTSAVVVLLQGLYLDIRMRQVNRKLDGVLTAIGELRHSDLIRNATVPAAEGEANVRR